MLPSLRSRLAVVGVLGALIAVVVTAIAVQQLTERGIRSDIERDLDSELAIRDGIAFYGLEAGNWTGVDEVVEMLARGFGERVAVATLDGEILADSEVLLFAREASLPSQPLIVDPASTLVDFGFDDGTFELLELDNQIASACLDRLNIPFESLLDETTGIDTVVPTRPITDAETEPLLTCLADTGVSDPSFVFDSLFFPELFDPGFEDIEPLEIDPVQLFIGYGDTRDDGVLSSLRSTTFWLAVGSVLALAAGLAIWMANRIGRPIASLTAATNRMSQGHLATRVNIESGDEIGDLGRAFNDMAESLQAEDQARKTLTTDVAHELRSPLANLRGYLEGIQDGVVEADDATIALLHEEATCLEALVDDLQQLSLAEAGRLELDLAPSDVGDLIERAVAAHQPGATSGGVELAATTREGVMLPLDADRFRQILGNLISNAVRHTPAGGNVTVDLTAGDPVIITVRDTGEGIEARHLPHLFDRFYRADESRTRATGGTGLGLAITRQLVHAHGGTINVASRVGEGTMFTLRFAPPGG